MRTAFAPLALALGILIAPTAQAAEANPQDFASSWGDKGVEFSTPQSEYCRISEAAADGKQFVVCNYGPNPTSVVGVVTGEQATASEYSDLPYTTLDKSAPAQLNPGQELTVGAGHCAVTEDQRTVCGIDNNYFTLK
ncbi:hypothetical protein QVA66_06240 [Staphylococcus chromogenes]|nr:hypothetical protein [Staphylococcus chromogenes]